MAWDTDGAAPRVALLGGGRLARALARTLGHRVVAVYARSMEEAAEVAALATSGVAAAAVTDQLDNITLLKANVVWIAVADRAIPLVVEQLATLEWEWRGIAAVHSSGLLPLAVLDPLQARGAVGVALHPNASIVGDEPIRPNTLWGGNADSVDIEQFAAWLLGRRTSVIPIADSSRPLYHAAASVAANFPVTLFALAVELYRSAGIDAGRSEALVLAFMSESVARVGRLGPQEAITGPIVRGDSEIVQAQLDSVRTHAPELATAFKELVRLTERFFTKE